MIARGPLILLGATLLIAGGFAHAIDIGSVLGAASKLSQVGKSNQPEQERLVGEQAALEILSKAPLAPLPGVQRYVSNVGKLLARRSERPEVNWRFAVVDDAAANAWAAPDGYIFITTGLMQDIQSEAELAGVLAHEISHVIQRHHLKAIQKSNQMSMLGDLASIAQDTANQEGNSVSLTLSPEMAALKQSIGTLYDKGLNRNDEYDADRLGVELAGKSGYDPYGLPTVLQLLGARGKDDPSMAVLLRTHPSIDDRLKKLEPVIEKLDPAYFPGKELRERYQHYVDL